MPWIDAFPRHDADYSQLDRVFRRQVPHRVPSIELFADHDFIAEVLGYEANGVAPDRDYADWQRYWLWRLAYQRIAEPDCVVVGLPGLYYPHDRLVSMNDTAVLGKGRRDWVHETNGTITTREQFDAYAWPNDPYDGAVLDFVAENAPPGMGLIVTSSGVLEWTMWLMGYERFAMALYDEPDLVRDVIDRIGTRFVEHYAYAARHDAVRGIWLGDDMGFKTQTLISPAHLREFIFPWQQRLAALAHDAGKPFLLHACGNLEPVMDDLIDVVRIDARHSFEDAILPVAEFKRRYGHRIAVLGGVDVDVLARRTPAEIRRYTRGVLDDCAPGGGYALGSGNSVANYIPVPNYIAMLEELAAFNRA